MANENIARNESGTSSNTNDYNRQRRNFAKKDKKLEYAKMPPQAIDLEDAVLGALMLEKDAYSRVADLLKPECFYKEANKTIFEAIQELGRSHSLLIRRRIGYPP